MKKYGFGVDVGGTSIKIGLFDMSGVVMKTFEIKTVTDNGGAEILDDIAAAIMTELCEEHISKTDVEGIGLGVPGPVGPDGTVYGCVNLGWGTFNVESALFIKTGIPVKAGNDANVAALGEMWQGGGKGHKDVVMVTLGTGVGGGIIIDGKMVAGFHGVGGEMGHMKVNYDETDICGCGKSGCLEQYTSATGIVRMARKKLATELRTTVLKKDALSSKAIFDAAKDGDVVALELVDDLCKILGRALANIACVIDPEVFVIGGGVSRAGEALVEGIRKYYSMYAFSRSETTKIVLASLGNDAGMYGCIRMLF